jgi:trigger factor
VFQYYRENPQALDQIRAPIFEDKVIDFILELAKVEDRVVTAEELRAEPEGEAAATAEEAKPKKRAAKKKTADAE